MAKKVETVKVKVEEVKTPSQKVWAFFKQSGSIVLARSEAFLGLLIGAASMIDWSPLLGLGQDLTGLNWKQGVTIGGIMFVKGLVAELVRRNGTRELEDGRLVPKAN